MATINKLIVDYNRSPQIDQIEMSDAEPINSFSHKIEFYNSKINVPQHKFWYYIPNAKMIKKGKGIVDIILSMSDTKLVDSIKSLDDKVDQMMHSIIPDCTLIPSMKKHNNYPALEVRIDVKSVCYDKENRKTNYMNIMNKSEVLLYIEFDSVLLKSTEYSRIWNVIQMKETVSIDRSINLFAIQSGPPPIQYNSNYDGDYDTDYDTEDNAPMKRATTGRIPGPPRGGGRMPRPPQEYKSEHKPEHNPAHKSEQKPSKHENTGSMYQPPTEDQLRNMIGKLKKPSTLTLTSTSTSTSTILNEPDKSLDVESVHISVDTVPNVNAKNTEIVKTIETSIPTPPPIKQQDTTNIVNLAAHTIKDTLDEQYLVARQYRQRFDDDLAKFTDLTTKIDIIIANTRLQDIEISTLTSTSTSTSTLIKTEDSDILVKSRDKDKDKNVNDVNDVNDDSDDEMDPFVIVRR